MERILLVGVVVFVTLFGSSGVNAEQLVMVAADAMNFRTEPSANSEQVSDCPKLYFGAVLDVLDEDSDWYYVEDMYGHKGWARAVYEGNVYLKDLPDNYLETHITARKAYELAKPFAEEWAEDAYLVQIFTKETGWNGLVETWYCRFCSPVKSELDPSEQECCAEDFLFLEVEVTPSSIDVNEQIQLHYERGGSHFFDASREPISDDFLDSNLLFSPEKIAEYRDMPFWIGEEVDRDELLNNWFTSASTNLMDLKKGEWLVSGFGYYIEEKMPGIISSTGFCIDAITGEVNNK